MVARIRMAIQASGSRPVAVGSKRQARREHDRDDRVDPADHFRGGEAHLRDAEQTELEDQTRNRFVDGNRDWIAERRERLAAQELRHVRGERDIRADAEVRDRD